MRIVQLVGWYFPESLGGSEVYVAGLASRLRDFGHNVSTAAPLAGLSGSREYRHDGIEVFRYPIPANATRDEAQARVEVRGTDLLREYLDRERPDIAHFHSLTTGLGVDEMEAAKSAGARVIFTAHLPALGSLCQRGTLMRWGEGICDGYPGPVKCAACMLNERGLSRPAAWALAWLGSLPGASSLPMSGRAGTAVQMHDFIRFRLNLQKRLLDVVDRFVVLNRWAFEVMVSSGAPKHKLVLNYLGHSSTGIETKPGPGAEPTRFPIRVGYVGRFAKGKGLDTMLSAIALLPPGLDLTFEFRGAVNNEAGKVIATRIESLRSRFPGISVEPAVPPELIFEIIRGFDVLCVPSVDYENGPTVVSEAHAVGTPVIGTAIGAMPELIQDGINGLLLPPGDARALTAALEKIARDPAATIDRWRSKLPAARTMKEIAADYESLYQGMLSESNQTSSAP